MTDLAATKPPAYTPSHAPRLVEGLDGVIREIVYGKDGEVMSKRIMNPDPVG